MLRVCMTCLLAGTLGDIFVATSESILGSFLDLFVSSWPMWLDSQPSSCGNSVELPGMGCMF